MWIAAAETPDGGVEPEMAISGDKSLSLTEHQSFFL